MRIDKFLSDMLIGSRKEVKKLIKDNRISVNGETVTSPDYPVNEDTVVYVDEEPVCYQKYQYYILNKPQGYLCTNDYSPNVLELIPERRKNLMPVGRLDKDTEGLLLLTDDGQLAHKLISPKNHVDKVYYVETKEVIDEKTTEIFAQPIAFSDFTSEPAQYQSLSPTSGLLTIHEGKYHQVKRMFGYLGCEVTFLKRISFAFLTLDGLQTREYRQLSEEEITKLKKIGDR